MNRQLWELYKNSERGKKAIATFNPDVEDIFAGIEDCFELTKEYHGIEEENIWYMGAMALMLALTCEEDRLLPNDQIHQRDCFEKFIDAYRVTHWDWNKKEQNWTRGTKPEDTLIAPNEYRKKSASLHILSSVLYYECDFFKPILYPSRFDIIQQNCDLLGIELPTVPHTTNRRAYLSFYYDLCKAMKEFQQEQKLSDAEFCACLYDFAPMLKNDMLPETVLPKPINIWFTGAGGKGDFERLDNPERYPSLIWACNERTRRGDIVVMYCLAPRSYIHSIWRADSNGTFHPFDYYNSRTTLTGGIKIPPISIRELKTDAYFSQLPLVKKNLQGLKGVELSASDYAALLRLIQTKGGDITNLPQLYSPTQIIPQDIAVERDVEEKLLIPLLYELGYTDTDWTRQLVQKAGRGQKAIPDFVFFPSGELHLQNAPLLIEAKLSMSSQSEFHKAFNQAYSYARLMRASLMGICDKDRLILYQADSNGVFDRLHPVFEDHWGMLKEVGVFAKLQKIIGRSAIIRYTN